MRRARIAVRGAVQGVGFRPFVHRLATDLGLGGWVMNSGRGVTIEVEGAAPLVDAFLIRLEREKPARAAIHGLECTFLDPGGSRRFEIRPSASGDAPETIVLPDIATCAECVAEVFDPRDRRYRYPFTNCTHCGPRYSILEALPYDRPNTAMKAFALCAACRREYEDPADRRFHAQPTACPACGPALGLLEPRGAVRARGDSALVAAAQAVLSGAIVAVKGLGGFHLLVHAADAAAVARLRARKHREEKPLAIMAPSLAAVRADCEVSPLEERVLCSPESPIVLLDRRPGAGSSAVAPNVAPGNPCLGVMLPYTPLHHLLLAAIAAPVVATSGNRAEEPICTDEDEARERLGGIADLFLVHDRPIVRHVDDSIVRVLLGRELVLRRARGYAPLPLRRPAAEPLLAAGAHLKSTVALAVGEQVFVSQHIGDLENEAARRAFRGAIASLRRLYRAAPRRVAADLHPDYASTAAAHATGLPLEQVQHHHAHVAACMAENELEGEVLGVAWDGAGLGPDGTLWGGEFLVGGAASCRRFAAFRTFRLPGGERAMREPRRSALGVLHELLGDAAFERLDLPPVAACTAAERRVLRRMLERRLNAPLTSSAGRLFDAAASLLGLRQRASFEGQAAMELEWAAAGGRALEPLPVAVREPAGAAGGDGASRPALEVDWGPLVLALLEEQGRGAAAGLLAARFHQSLAEAVVEVARRAGCERVVLAGGCFQNRILMEWVVERLQAAGFRPYWHQRFPPNDGSIALGQAVVAAARARAAEGDGACVLPSRGRS